MRERAGRFVFPPLVCLLLADSGAGAGDFVASGYASGGWNGFFTEIFRAIDVVGFALLTLNLVLCGMAADFLLHLRVAKLIPENLLSDVQAEMANGEYEKALELCEKSDCLIGEVFAAALSKTDYSFERMTDAFKGDLEIHGMAWRQWAGQFRVAAMTGLLAGMAGAVVEGMRFVADLAERPDIGLALASSFAARASVHNILFSALLGLTMSILAFLVYAVGSSKLEKILLEAGRLGEELLDPFRPLPMPPEEE